MISQRFFRFDFPTESIWDGVPFGNGLFGVTAWGGERQLKFTFNRADFWDRRGGIKWKRKQITKI